MTGVIAERKATILRVFDMFFALRSGLEKRKKRIMELVEDVQNRFPQECKAIAKRCADKKTPLKYREATSLLAKLEAVRCLGDAAICKKILKAEPIGVEYFKQVLELCGERRDDVAVKFTKEVLSFDAKSWTCDGRYSAFSDDKTIFS